MDLAAIQIKKRKLDDAESTLCTVLATARDNQTVRVQCLYRLSAVAVRRHAYAAAIKLANHALSLVEKLAAADKAVALAQMTTSLAWLAMELSELENADVFLRQARMTLGFGGADTALALKAAVVQAELLRRQGRLDEASHVAREALDRFVAIVGRDHEGIVELIVSLADTRLDGGDLAGAEEELKNIRIASAHLGEAGGPVRVRLSCAQARVSLGRGDNGRAREKLARVLAAREKAGDGLDVARIWRLLSRVERADRSYARAVECAHHAAQIYLKVVSVENSESQRCIKELGQLRLEALSAGVEEASIPSALTGLRLGDRLEPGWEKTDAAVRTAIHGARKAISAGEWERALDLLKPAGRLRAGEARVYYQRARALDQGKKTAEAIAAMGIAIELRPAEPTMYLGRAVLCAKARRYDRMIVDATYALLLGAERAGCLFVRGCAHYGLGHFQTAVADFAACKAAAPGDLRMCLWSGKALLQLGRLPEAEAELRKVADQRNEHEVEARLRLAILYRRRGKLKQALGECSRLIERSPDHPTGTWFRAVLHFDRQSYGRALADMDRYEKPGAEVSLRLWLYRWLCLRHAEGRQVANAALRKGIGSVGEDDVLTRVARTVLANDAGALSNVLAHYGSDPDQLCEACFYLGAWREAEGDVDGALALFDRAIAQKRLDSDQFHSAVAARARLRGRR